MGTAGGMLRNWIAAQAREAEIAEVPEAVPGEPGLSREDFGRVARMAPDRVTRMEAMAAAFGVSEGQLWAHPEVRRDAALACAGCGEDAACRRAFAVPGGPAAETSGFCPNAETYRALALGPGH